MKVKAFYIPDEVIKLKGWIWISLLFRLNSSMTLYDLVVSLKPYSEQGNANCLCGWVGGW